MVLFLCSASEWVTSLQLLQDAQAQDKPRQHQQCYRLQASAQRPSAAAGDAAIPILSPTTLVEGG